MDAAALGSLCLLLAQGQVSPPATSGVLCPSAHSLSRLTEAISPQSLQQLRTSDAREGIARVAIAEAGDQGDSGLAAVVYTIINRLADGRWGATVDDVLNAPFQFEPVLRAGGDWRGLAKASPASQARIDTILNLALAGYLPDLTHGARFFQNPAIVAERARRGRVSSKLIAFGGQRASAVIGAHSFYIDDRTHGVLPTHLIHAAPSVTKIGTATVILQTPIKRDSPAHSPLDSAPANGDPAQALFVTKQGQISADSP